MRIVCISTAAVFLALGGCDRVVGYQKQQQTQTNASADLISPIRVALADHNFSLAAEQAATAADADPHNPIPRLLQAEAEAQLNNAGLAAKALGQALDLGLPNAATAVKDHSFDPVRKDAVFRAVTDRIDGIPPDKSAASASEDVSIGADGSVHAGSVSIAGER